MDLEYLQTKYPEFIYEGSSWRLDQDNFIAEFKFLMGDIEFCPSITIRGVDPVRINSLDPAVVSNLVFNMGLAEIPSYWKAACPFRIIIKAGYLDKNQIGFWRDLISNMGQFFYENNLPFIYPEFHIAAPKTKTPVYQNRLANRFLVPLGGGKDSLATLEILRSYLNKKNFSPEQIRENLITFTLNPNAELNDVATAAAVKNIFIRRTIDPRLIELNRKGYFNGHTPFSSILSVLGSALAVFFDCNVVAISQELSSNEGNIIYRDRIINHQYSKTFEFENKFRKYSKKYLVKNLEYFSFLRPLYELQVAMIFSRYPRYFPVFLSCNRGFTIKNVQSGTKTGWCGICSKCLSVYAMVYPFIGAPAAVKIFGQDLFKNAGLLPLMRELLGQGDYKPFECVGTFQEARAALYLSLVRAERETLGGLPVLLQIFKDEYLKLYPDIEAESEMILNNWSNKNNLPKNLQNELKNALKSSQKPLGLDKI